MRRCLALAVVVAFPALAHADPTPRETALSVTAGGALMGPCCDPGSGPDRLGSLVMASLAWERPPAPYPAWGTAIAQGQIVPEATLFSFGDRGGLMGGLRLQADIAQSHMGVWGNSVRMAFWLAGRFGAIQGADGGIAGGDFGEMFFTQSNWRIGMQMGVYTWIEGGTAQTMPVANGGVAFKAEPPGSRQLSVTFGLTVAH